MMTVCQVAGIGAATLILPCSWSIRHSAPTSPSMLMQALLAAFALALMVAVWTVLQDAVSTCRPSARTPGWRTAPGQQERRAGRPAGWS